MLIDGLYEYVQAGTFSIFLVMGLFFMLDKPLRDLKDSFVYARRVFGAAFLLYSLFIAASWIINYYKSDPTIVAALFLSRFFLYGSLAETVFNTLIDGSYNIYKGVRVKLFKCTIYSLCIILSVALLPEAMKGIALLIASLVFTFEVIAILFRFLKRYHTIKKSADNLISEDIEVFIKWILNSAYALGGVGFLSMVVPFVPPVFYAVFLLIATVISLYMSYSLFQYTQFLTLNRNAIEVVESQDREDEIVEIEKLAEAMSFEERSSETNEKTSAAKVSTNILHLSLDRQIKQWVSKHGYIEEGLTVQSLAVRFNTNRTYLSAYINSKYGMTFRDWISELRIEYSKQLLLTYNLPAKKIAEMVGYAPGSYNSAFIKANNVSPAKWRKTNLSS